jgi:hypothetical protein
MAATIVKLVDYPRRCFSDEKQLGAGNVQGLAQESGGVIAVVITEML